MTSRQRILNALHCRPTDRPPVWFMRQAGRYLPEYRELKARHGFRTLVQTPELSTEVTLQPLRRFPLDAAILFSDILTIPEALGYPYSFRDTGGIAMEKTLRDPAGIRALNPSRVTDHLAYVPDALRLIREEIGTSTALLGFAGSPWTLAAYMIEGGSPEPFFHSKSLFHSDREAFDALLEKLTEAVLRYLRSQSAAGADAVQIFDSWAIGCPATDYEAMSLRWIREIVRQLRAEGIPLIVYARGAAGSLKSLGTLGANCLSLDHTIDLLDAHQSLPANLALQGNLDPIVPSLPPAAAVPAAQDILSRIGGRKGYIFNTGHGVTPATRIDTVEALVTTVAEYHPSINPQTTSAQ